MTKMPTLRVLAAGMLAGALLLPLASAASAADTKTEDEIAVLLERGHREIAEGDYLLARRAFRLVLKRDDDNLDALEGLARAALGIEDWNDGFEAVSDALEIVTRDKAQQRRFKALEIALETGEAKFGWYLRSYNIYHRQLQDDPAAWSDADFALAIARSALVGFRREEDDRYLDEAVRYLRRAISSGGASGGEASTLLARVEKVYRASLGNEKIAKYARRNTLSRAEVVDLIYNQMNLTELLPGIARRNAGETGKDGNSDYAEHPLAEDIVDLHRRNIRGISIVNGTFRPEAPISREEFALLLEDLIVAKSGNKRLASSFIGSPSPFGDLDPARISFNAFMTATSRGLLHPDGEGNIHPTTPMTGADAILALRTLSGNRNLIPAK